MKAKLLGLLSILSWLGADWSHGEMRVRVADYNIKFLSVEDLDAKPQRKQRLKAVIEQLKPDILALQEIKDRQALEELFESNTWSILIDDDSNDAQDLAIAVRRPLKFKDRADLDADDADFLFPGPTFENLFRNRRDVLVGVVEIPGETEPLHVMVVHEKSRLGGRAVTDPVREGAARALVQKLDRDYEDKRFILLGDFNDNPDDKSLNILETGDIDAQGGAEENEGAFLSNPAERLVALDQVSHGKSAADINPQTGRIDVITTGSRARNNDNRGNNTNTGDILFDQILFPAILAPLYVNDSFRIFDAGVAIEGTGGQNGDQASDHLPVYADFVFGEMGGDNGGGETPILGVRIASLLANPEGEDQGKESITLTNQGTTTIDLSGWKLRDRAGGEAPVSGQLAAGASKTVVLPRSLALNNNGDEVALIGSDGIERHRVSYTRHQVFQGQEIQF
jgi:endonuclease/exonuclease/phosphatase family metal-dependent hydrolase